MICLSTPVLYESLVNFQKVSGSSVLQQQVDKLERAALEVCNAGRGSQRTVRLELPLEDGSSILIGGISTAERMSVGFRLEGMSPVRTYLTDPNIRFLTPGNATLVIYGPVQVLVLRCANDAQGFAVEVTA